MKESPSSTLYQLGRGVVYIADYDEDCGTLSYTDIGNCPRFDAEVTEEILPHYSSRSGTRTKDKQVILETGYTLSFDLDEVSKKNLQIYLKAEIAGGGNVLRANKELTKEYAVKFVSDNPAGPNETWEFWRTKVTPGGAFGLISDEWSTISLSAEGLSDAACHSTSPYFDVTFCTTTSTSTTSTSSSTLSTTSSTAAP